MFYAFRPCSVALQHVVVRVFYLEFRQCLIGRFFPPVVVALYLCMHVWCMHVCTYVRMYVRLYVGMYLGMHVWNVAL